MAHVRQGQLTASPQWWRHLRNWKRDFWKRERQAGQSEAGDLEAWNVSDLSAHHEIQPQIAEDL